MKTSWRLNGDGMGPRATDAGMLRVHHLRHFALVLGTAGLPLLLSACMQIDTHVKLHEDGSATITEKVRFSRQLLDHSGKEGTAEDLSGCLKKEAAEERAKQMGKGAVLVSHEVKDVEGGAREALSVYQIGDLNELLYLSPFIACKDYAQNGTARFNVSPVLSPHGTGWQPGQVIVNLQPVQPPKWHEKPTEGEPGPAPVTLQVYRELQPMFREILKDFKVKLTFEAYTTISPRFGVRGRLAAPTRVDLINFTDQDLDKFGGKFMENEELMLDLLQRQFHSKIIAEHVADWPVNLTLPVFHYGGEIFFRPSQHFFNKFFKDKSWDPGPKAGGPRPFNFDEIGFKKTDK